VHVERFSLVSVLDEIRALHVGRQPQGEVAFVVDAVPDLPEMETDRVKLQEVVRNLVDNAAKFTQRGSVRMEARPGERAGWVTIAVRDTGRGIGAEDLPRIFEEFRQVGENNTRTTNGVGLGLAIVKRLMDVLGGRITVESTLGEGSTFTLSLPVNSVDGAVTGAVDGAALATTSRLVAKVARRTNKSHREIQARINRATRVRSDTW